jgi:hypothetical protein
MLSLLRIIVQWNGSWHTCNPKTKAESISEIFHWLQESCFSDPKTEDMFQYIAAIVEGLERLFHDSGR